VESEGSNDAISKSQPTAKPAAPQSESWPDAIQLPLSLPHPSFAPSALVFPKKVNSHMSSTAPFSPDAGAKLQDDFTAFDIVCTLTGEDLTRQKVCQVQYVQ
jgi:hypothetical protein